jgi:hypothetical protein
LKPLQKVIFSTDSCYGIIPSQIFDGDSLLRLFIVREYRSDIFPDVMVNSVILALFHVLNTRDSGLLAGLFQPSLTWMTAGVICGECSAVRRVFISHVTGLFSGTVIGFPVSLLHDRKPA